jgi:TldD protein
MDIILGGSQLALQVHESCGHAVELDRIFGMEANFAGMSFLTQDKWGDFKYGSPIVNLTVDATIDGGLGGYGFDDDGVPARRLELVKNGIFKNYISSRDTAAKLGVPSSGNARAENWNSIPLVRMSNVNLEPGDISFEEMIATTKRGILLTENRSWSIDDLRLNFQFGMELGYMIEDGKITGIVKNPTYTGITPKFWNSCDAIADKNSWKVIGVPNCGKGQPMQTMRVGHGVSYARFRNVKVGVGYDK